MAAADLQRRLDWCAEIDKHRTEAVIAGNSNNLFDECQANLPERPCLWNELPDYSPRKRTPAVLIDLRLCAELRGSKPSQSLSDVLDELTPISIPRLVRIVEFRETCRRETGIGINGRRPDRHHDGKWFQTGNTHVRCHEAPADSLNPMCHGGVFSHWQWMRPVPVRKSSRLPGKFERSNSACDCKPRLRKKKAFRFRRKAFSWRKVGATGFEPATF